MKANLNDINNYAELVKWWEILDKKQNKNIHWNSVENVGWMDHSLIRLGKVSLCSVRLGFIILVWIRIN